MTAKTPPRAVRAAIAAQPNQSSPSPPCGGGFAKVALGVNLPCTCRPALPRFPKSALRRTRHLTVRECLARCRRRDRRDDTRVSDGRGKSAISGVPICLRGGGFFLERAPSLLEEFSTRRVIALDHRTGFHGLAIARRFGYCETDRRIHDVNFAIAGDGSTDQFAARRSICQCCQMAVRTSSASHALRARGRTHSQGDSITASWERAYPRLK